jgi:2-polyprenyl-6-methoxyphenol hydroxylase-like FAD-dependent oxidoreductase
MAAALEEMARHVSPDLAVHLRDAADEAVEPFLLSTVSDRVHEWWRPGLLVIGDAAHVMSPVGGQGLNVAIRDAAVAANHLVPVLAAGCSAAEIDAELPRIEAERLPEVAEIQRLQALPPPVLLRDRWWNRALVEVITFVLGSGLVGPRTTPLLRRFAWGVTEVKVQV